jgi:Cu/Zn superoxide dismutase
MSWGYGDKVIDYTAIPDPLKWPDVKPDIFQGARASAVMIGMDGRSYFRLRVSGIAATGGTYGVHLHQGTCDANNPGPPGGAGPHYNVTWAPPFSGLGGVVNNTNEVWLDLEVDPDGDARSSATVSFIPKGERSIVLHAKGTAADGTAGPRLACMPFNIKVYGN